MSPFLPADPYVKVSLVNRGRRLKKRKTSVKKSELSPVYNEALTFDIPGEMLKEIILLIAVIDYDRSVVGVEPGSRRFSHTPVVYTSFASL